MNKWFWKMAYCKRRAIPPAQLWAWGWAEAAWELVNKLPVKGTKR